MADVADAVRPSVPSPRGENSMPHQRPSPRRQKGERKKNPELKGFYESPGGGMTGVIFNKGAAW